MWWPPEQHLFFLVLITVNVHQKIIANKSVGINEIYMLMSRANISLYHIPFLRKIVKFYTSYSSSNKAVRYSACYKTLPMTMPGNCSQRNGTTPLLPQWRDITIHPHTTHVNTQRVVSRCNRKCKGCPFSTLGYLLFVPQHKIGQVRSTHAYNILSENVKEETTWET
jgi:hypothetical protein